MVGTFRNTLTTGLSKQPFSLLYTLHLRLNFRTGHVQSGSYLDEHLLLVELFNSTSSALESVGAKRLTDSPVLNIVQGNPEQSEGLIHLD